MGREEHENDGLVTFTIICVAKHIDDRRFCFATQMCVCVCVLNAFVFIE